MSYKQLGKTATKSAFERLSFPWIRDLVPALLRLPKKDTPSPAASTPLTKTSAKDSRAKNRPAPSWLAELANAHGIDDESTEFVEGLKKDFFSYRVFVFTPRGDVIDLPTQSTAIDFAYAIHSELGDHMAGAKVNGKLVSFDTKLRNGDIVEITERPSARPTTKWLDYARTSMARRHIHAALDQQNPSAPPITTSESRQHTKKKHSGKNTQRS